MNITDASDDIVTNIEFPVETGNLRNDLASARMVQRQYYLNGGPSAPSTRFAPRVSFAWDPTKKGQMSIRGGSDASTTACPTRSGTPSTRTCPATAAPP